MRVNKWLAGVGLGVLVSSLLVMPAAWAGTAHSDMVGCDGCHVPHNAKAGGIVPLWNGSDTTVTFTMYTSRTFQGTIDNQPSGASRLCLSCHDGANPNYLWMSNTRKFGATDLAKSHPISFVYDAKLAGTDGALKDPSQPSTLGRTIAEDLLDTQSKMQCNSCHDVHTSGVGKALRGYNYGYESVKNPDGTTSQVHHGAELCRMCHLK